MAQETPQTNHYEQDMPKKDRFQKKAIRVLFFAVNIILVIWLTFISKHLFTNVLRGEIGPLSRSVVVALYFLATLLTCLIIYKIVSWSQLQSLLKKPYLWVTIFLLALLSRLAWVYLYGNIEIRSDFALYFNLAKSVAETGQIPPEYRWYVSFAPYVLGYVTFLASLISIFGSSITVIQITNCVLAAFVAVLLFLIAKQLTGKPETGVMTAIFWIVMPAMIGMTALPQTELPFILLLLASVYLLLSGSHYRPVSRRLIMLIPAALLIIMMNEIRPLGSLVILAFLGFTLTILRFQGKFVRIYLPAIAAVLVLIFLASSGSGLLKDRFLGTAVARNTYGFGLYLGLNDRTNGTWSADDAALLDEATREGLSAQTFQERMVGRSISRLNELIDNDRLMPLLTNKVRAFWTNPNAFLEWTSELMPANYYRRRILEIMSDASYYIYTGVIIFALIECLISGLIKNYRFHAQAFFSKLLLFIYLVSMAIFDNNGRYVVPMIPFLFILAASGIQHLNDLFQTRLVRHSVH